MSILAPALLGFLGLLPVIIILYLIRAQRRHKTVSSTLLWRNMMQDIEVRTRFRRPPFSLLLLLQLLAVLLGTIALSQPFWWDSTPPSRLVVLVLDASASMLATDVQPSRFESAKAQARQVINNLAGDGAAAIVRAGPKAELLAQGRDRTELLAAIDSARAADGPSDLTTAWLLAGSLASADPGVAGEVIVFSDGNVSDQLPPISANSRMVLIGNSGNNQAIVQVGVRRPLSGAAKPSAFVRIANYSTSPVERQVRALGDGLQFKEQTIRLAARGTTDLVFEPPVGTRLFSVQLGGNDALASDDRVDAVIPRPAERDVLLVSASPEVLSRALTAIPELAVSIVKPQDYVNSGHASLVVFDGFLPPELPSTPLLIVNPPAGSSFASGRVGRPAFAVGVDPESPLLAGVDLGPVEFGRVSTLVVPPWASTVVRGPDGPIILEGEREGRRMVIMGFEPAASNLPKLVAFPAMISNSVDWLLAGMDGAVPVGSTVRLPGGLDGELVSPDNQAQAVGGVALYDNTDRAGRYIIRRGGADPQVLFAANLADERVSDITPRPLTLPNPVQNTALPAVGGDGRPEGKNLWPLLAALALGVFGLEWFVFTRRSRT